MRALHIFLLVAGLSLSGAAGADVVPSTQDGYTDSKEFGEVAFPTAYRTPNGIPYRRGLGPKFGLVSHGVEWAPKNLPVYVQIGRDARGAFLFFSTLIADREGRSQCWTETTLKQFDVMTSSRLVRTVERETAVWAAACPAARTFGAAAITSAMAAAQKDLMRASDKFVAARAKYLAPIEGEDERELGVPSFLPDRISQPLLDAIADSCGLPRPQLQLQAGGRIAVSRIESGTQQTADETSASDCAFHAVEYFPGASQKMM